MQTLNKVNLPVNVAITILLALLFTIDYVTPTNVALWAFYPIGVVLSARQDRPFTPFLVALASTVLVTVGYLVDPFGINATAAMMQNRSFLNRTFGIVTLFVVAYMAYLVISDRLRTRRLIWLQAGQAKLSESLLGEQGTADVSRNAVSALSRYMNAQIGVLHLLERDALVPSAAYGGLESTLAERPAGVAGLAGEVAASGKAMLVRDVPAGYLPLGSSIGAAAPATLLIAPVKAEGRVRGVIEFGFTRKVARDSDFSVELDMLNLSAESIGIALRAAAYRQHLQELLEETQRQGEELQTQQEELRVSNEELEEQGRGLRESQARMEHQQAELEQTNVQLEEQSQRLEMQKATLLDAQRHLQANASELEKANRHKSEFLANMSHELRTPLNSSLILSHILAENKAGNLSSDQVQYAQTIHASNNDLLTLINDILDLSKIEAGHVDLQPETVRITVLLEQLRNTFDPLARDKGLAFHIKVDADAPTTLHTDEQRLKQILKNLLSNAFKFTPKGQVELHVSQRPNGRIGFAIRDSGIGIAPEQHAVIFEAFRQADGTTSRKYGGTGLGLSISRELALALQGGVTVDSTPGEGSTFTLEVAVDLQATAQNQPGLPAAGNAGKPFTAANVAAQAAALRAATQSAPGPAPAADAPQATDDRLSRQRERLILVVEDDAPFAEILYQLAHDLNFDCICATTGAEAIELARGHRPQGILLDVGLPDQSGLSVLEQLKRNPVTRHIPIHVISAEDHVQTALELGAVGYALKPVARDDLVQAIAMLEERLQTRARRVLVVEDDAQLRDNIALLLQADDVEILTVGTVSAALEQLAASTFDCMVMDLVLPDASGYELLEAMAEGDKYAFPPVIVYTGRALTYAEEQQLRRYSHSIIIKGARSPERLVDEVTLFLHRVEASLPADQQKLLLQARQRDSIFEGRTLLLAEDDIRNIFALSSILEPLGAKLIITRNGREAVDYLEKNSDVDLALMDIMMPEMDGLTAMREIRGRLKLTKLPIIALTAKVMADDRRNCIEAGASDYISKPIDVEKLISLCRVWMPK